MDLKALIAKMDKIEARKTLMEAGDPAAYKDAQTKMANLEKAAKYNGDDPIVRQRMGLPPKLPSIDQWDGKQPAPVGKPDWVAQLTTLGGAGQAQQGAIKQNAAIDTSNAFVKDKLAALNALVAKLAVPAAGAPVAKESIQFKGAIAKVLGESFGYNLYEADPVAAPAAAAPAAAAPAAPAAGGNAEIIKQIQAIMAELADVDDPAVADALGKAQAAIDAAGKAPAAAVPGAPATPGAGQPGGPDQAAKLKRFEELIAKIGATGGVSGAAPAPAAKKPAGGATQPKPAAKPGFSTGIAPQVKMPGMSQQQNDALSMMAAGNMGA